MGGICSAYRKAATIGAIVPKPCSTIYRLRIDDSIFTDKAGQVLQPWEALYGRTKFDNVFYRGAPMDELFNTMQTVSAEGHDDEDLEGVEVFCGYSPYKDAFYYLHYVKHPSSDTDDDCLVCLERLHDSSKNNIAIRIGGANCAHNIHYHCYKSLLQRNMGIAGCCKGRLHLSRIAFHMKIVGYTEHRIIPRLRKLYEYRTGKAKLKEASYNPREIIRVVSATWAPDMIEHGCVNDCVRS